MQVGVTQGSEGNALDRQETTSPSTSLSVWPASVKMLGFFHFKLKMFLGPNLERLNVLLCTFFLFVFVLQTQGQNWGKYTDKKTDRKSEQTRQAQNHTRFNQQRNRRKKRGVRGGGGGVLTNSRSEAGRHQSAVSHISCQGIAFHFHRPYILFLI